MLPEVLLVGEFKSLNRLEYDLSESNEDAFKAFTDFLAEQDNPDTHPNPSAIRSWPSSLPRIIKKWSPHFLKVFYKEV